MLAAKRGDTENTAYFMRLSPQRLESARAFAEQDGFRRDSKFSGCQALPLYFESPRIAMAVNRYFSDVFRAQNSNQCASSQVPLRPMLRCAGAESVTRLRHPQHKNKKTRLCRVFLKLER